MSVSATAAQGVGEPTGAGSGDGAASLDVRPLTRAIGAEVSGVDLGVPFGEELATELRRLLSEHLVLFFRDQALDDDQHLRVARVFGEPNVYPATRARGLDQPLEWIEDGPDSPPKADLWHTDVAFMPEPPDVAVLSMQATPEVGGDTLWLSLEALYGSYSAPVRAMFDGLEQDLHPGPDMKAKLELQFGPGIYEKVADEFRGARHPLVRVHPVTGRRSLFLCGAYPKGIAGLAPDESDAVLALARSHLGDPNLSCRWRWAVDDLVIWDERATNHRALSDHHPAQRRVRRCTVGAGIPIGPADEGR